jgi:hypothetical protein
MTTRAEFLAFIRQSQLPKKASDKISDNNVVYLSVTTTDLPDDSIEIDNALLRASLTCFDYSKIVTDDFKTLHDYDQSIATLNLAMHFLIIDSNLPFFQSLKDWQTFFSDSAKNAIITNLSNEASSNGFDYNDAYKNKIAFERDLIKTVFGQRYYAIAQRYYAMNEVISCVV